MVALTPTLTALLLASARVALAADNNATSTDGKKVFYIVATEDDKFEPETITGAKVGDVLEFHFLPKNHSVALSSFDLPCAPVREDQGGFYSGFFATEEDDDGHDKAFSVTLTDDKPMAFYSTQDRECSKGMVGVINPSQNQTLAKYREDASKLSKAVSPAAPYGGEIVDSDRDVDDLLKDIEDDEDDRKDDEDDRDSAAAGLSAGLMGALGAVAAAVVILA